MTPFTLPRLLPAPRSLRLTDGVYSLHKQGIILLQTSRPGALLPIARRLQQSLRQDASVIAEISAADWEEEAETLCVRLVLDPHLQGHAQRYRLQVVPTEIRVEASTQEGLFYGVYTLQQLFQQCGDALTCLEIDDWPDLDERGMMLDISRDKVSTMETLFYLVELLASWKINQLQLYTEHTFAYHAHPEVWADASPMTGEQILELDAFCCERFIKLIPCQNTFGHMARWLTHPRYQPLAETMDAFPVPWATRRDRSACARSIRGAFNSLRVCFRNCCPIFPRPRSILAVTKPLMSGRDEAVMCASSVAENASILTMCSVFARLPGSTDEPFSSGEIYSRNTRNCVRNCRAMSLSWSGDMKPITPLPSIVSVWLKPKFLSIPAPASLPGYR